MYLESEEEFDLEYRKLQDAKLLKEKTEPEEDPGFVDVLTIEKSSWDLKVADDVAYLTKSPIPDRDIKREKLMRELLQ